MTRATESARAAYRKSRTLENADKLLITIDGISPYDAERRTENAKNNG